MSAADCPAGPVAGVLAVADLEVACRCLPHHDGLPLPA